MPVESADYGRMNRWMVWTRLRKAFILNPSMTHRNKCHLTHIQIPKHCVNLLFRSGFRINAIDLFVKLVFLHLTRHLCQILVRSHLLLIDVILG